jgi:serine/threonine protein kinase
MRTRNKSKLIDIETSYFPDILQEMYNLVKDQQIPIKDLNKDYGKKLARLMSTRKYSYIFESYIKWGGEALLLKLQEKSGTGRTVAAKIADPNFNATGRRVVIQGSSPKDFEIRRVNSFKDRFKRGMKLQQDIEDGVSFTHGFVPKIIEISQKPLYFVMQYISGVDFDVWVSRADLNERLKFFENLLKFAAELHLHGVYHRDLKPNNVMVRQEKPCLIDFTTAKSIDDDDNVTLHQIGIGCRLYAAPETLHDIRQSDWRSDIYSLGKMLEMAWTQKAPTSDGKHLPKPFFKVYEKATQFNKSERYQFVSEFLNDYQKAILKTTLPVKARDEIQELEKFLDHFPRVKSIVIPLYRAMIEVSKEKE